MRSELEFDLALRQQRLLMRSEILRAALVQESVVLEAPLAAADQVRAAANWLYSKRDWIVGGVVVLLVVRPRRAWRVVRWGWWLWRSARRALPWLAAAGLVAPGL